MYDTKSTFGIIDYCVFAAVLTISMGIGVFASFRGNKSAEQFLMGNRAFGTIPVSMSLLTSFVSAISLLGFTGEVYAYGLQISMFLVGTVLGIWAATILIHPVLFPLKLTSVNEYLELRFKSPILCKAVTLISCISGFIYMGICLYAPTIALASVTTLTSHTYIYILGIVVTVYSSLGGIRAVIWTDMFQLVVMISGLFVIVLAGIINVGGPSEIWNKALAGGRLDVFNMSLSIYERHTFLNTIFFGFLLNFSFYGISQINTQRICSVSKIEDAKRVMMFTLVGMIVIYTLIFLGGLVGYTAYADCDPWVRELIHKKEEILSYFVVNRLSFIIGLPGVFVATLTGGALSSLSSVMNALVAMVWRDLCSDLVIFKNMQPKTAGIMTKIFSFIIGVTIIGIALLASRATNIVQFSNTVTSGLFAPILGVFLVGFMFPRTNMKGVWTGFACSMFICTWISCGSFMYNETKDPLPLSIEGCPAYIYNQTTSFNEHKILSLFNDSTTFSHGLLDDDHSETDFPLMRLYAISYTLYKIIGTVTFMVVSILVSALTGNLDVKDVDPKFITPCLRKFYWGKDFVLEENEENTTITKDKQTELEMS